MATEDTQTLEALLKRKEKKPRGGFQGALCSKAPQKLQGFQGGSGGESAC